MTQSTPAVQKGDLVADRYRVEGFIGEGGMSVVVEATDCETNSLVAVKIMRRDARKHPQLVQRFLREARFADELRSDSVVRVHDAGLLDSGQAYLVMERLAGEDLDTCLQREGRLELRDAVDTVLQAARALAAAHSLGVVHRDIKPSNLFVSVADDGRRTVKLLDFGLSKLRRTTTSMGLETLTGPEVQLGTVHYMAPEQWLSPSDVDGRADVWALGVVLHELVTGRKPFEAENPIRLFEQVSQTPAPQMSQRARGIPTELADIGDRCLAKNPADRCEIRELVAALEWILEVLSSSHASAAARALFGPAVQAASDDSWDDCPATLRSADLLATAHTELATASFIPQVMTESAHALAHGAREVLSRATRLALRSSLSSACTSTA